jgi:hypothetical protein
VHLSFTIKKSVFFVIGGFFAACLSGLHYDFENWGGIYRQNDNKTQQDYMALMTLEQRRTVSEVCKGYSSVGKVMAVISIYRSDSMLVTIV